MSRKLFTGLELCTSALFSLQKPVSYFAHYAVFSTAERRRFAS